MIERTRTPERNAELWLTVCNSGMDLASIVSNLSEKELRVWVEVAITMDIPQERTQVVVKEFNQR